MKKSIFISLFIIVLFVIAGFSNPKILKEHKPRKKNGILVFQEKGKNPCQYCHNNTTNLKMKKGQDYKKVQKTKTCQGKGCHS